jgi:hypothetical protein
LKPGFGIRLRRVVATETVRPFAPVELNPEVAVTDHGVFE